MGTSFVSYTGAAGAPAATDPFFSSVVLLTHFDVDTGIWKDSSSFNHTLTAVGSTTTAETTQKKFGASCFRGVKTPSPFGLRANQTNFFLNFEFTVEVWVYLDPAIGANMSSGTIAGLFGGGISNSNSVWMFSLEWQTNGAEINQWVPKLEYTTNGSTIFNTSGVIPAETVTAGWHSIAATRNGITTNGIKIFFDGNIIGQGTYGDSLRGADVLRNFVVGAYSTSNANANTPNGSPFGGLMDELRITRGVCRYTAAYTPATQPFPNSG